MASLVFEGPAGGFVLVQRRALVTETNERTMAAWLRESATFGGQAPAILELARAHSGPGQDLDLERAIGFLARMLACGQLVAVRLDDAPRQLDAPKHVLLSDLAPEPHEPPISAPTIAREAVTWFEAWLVDGADAPLPGVEVTLEHGGVEQRLVSDASGRIRIDRVTSRAATLRIPYGDTLAAALDRAWSAPTAVAPLVASGDTLVVHPRGRDVGPIALAPEVPRRLSLQPFVVLGRLSGMLFDSDRSFPLPLSHAAFAEMRVLYERCAPCRLLVVGHADPEGKAAYNETLSLDRAHSVMQYLTDDVEAWLDRFTRDPPAGKRWGDREVQHMLHALPDLASRPSGQDLVRWFQETRGLVVDGIVGANTRRALVTEIMTRDGTTLPPGVEAQAHGCGEAFPLGEADGQGADRRVELFFFGDPLGVRPSPLAFTSAVGSTEYPSWLWRAHETYARVIGDQSLEILLHDDAGAPIPDIEFTVTLPAGATIEGKLDARGHVRLDSLPAGNCRVDFPTLRQGFAVHSITPLGAGA